MKRFSFRLDQVRRWREDQAELEELRLQQLHSELHAIEEARHEIETEASESRRKVLAQQSVTAEELNTLEAFHEYAKHEIERLKVKGQEVEVHLEQQRQRVLDAHRSFQLLDGLRDKALSAWTSARNREQEELGAELYLGRLGRRKEL